jgi:hypothetical protein
MDHPMKAIVGEVDIFGLRRLLPDDTDPSTLWPSDPAARPAQPTTLVWALLDEDAAEDLRAEVHAGRHREACGLLLNRAVELISLAAAAPRPRRPADMPETTLTGATTRGPNLRRI